MSFLKSKEEIVAQQKGSIYESVTKRGDIWQVKTTFDIPRSLVNAFVSKAKKEHGVDPRETWSDKDLAELFVKYISSTFTNIESLPVKAILGDDVETEGEASSDVQPEESNEPVTQTEEPAQTEVQGEVTEPVQQTQPLNNGEEAQAI